MSQPPSPDDLDHALFFVKYWQYFTAGLLSLAGVTAVVRKGSKIDKITPLSEKHIDNKLKICASELEDKIQDKIQTKLDHLKTDMLREIALMIKADKNG